MKKYNVYFSFSDEFTITFQIEDYPPIKFSANSKNMLFKKIQNQASIFYPKDSFSIGPNSFPSIDRLLNHLQNKSDNIRFQKNLKKEEKVLGEEVCDKCDGTGDSDKRDSTGDFLRCPRCTGPGKIKIWG